MPQNERRERGDIFASNVETTLASRAGAGGKYQILACARTGSPANPTFDVFGSLSAVRTSGANEPDGIIDHIWRGGGFAGGVGRVRVRGGAVPRAAARGGGLGEGGRKGEPPPSAAPPPQNPPPRKAR